MKKFLCLILALVMLMSLAACSGNGNSDNNNFVVGNETGEEMQTILTPSEYVLYQNIFYNDQGADYVNKETIKKGIFTKIRDEFNEKERYYVWGYNDNTKCCDWQWEFVPADKDSLPTIGSTITVTGMFMESDSALDGYWIENAAVETVVEYKNVKADMDLTTMGGTLERVQLINMQRFTERFEGKTVAVYGRIESETSIQHPYYDNAFSQHFITEDEMLPFGSVAIVTGVYKLGVIEEAKLTETKNY